MNVKIFVKQDKNTTEENTFFFNCVEFTHPHAVPNIYAVIFAMGYKKRHLEDAFLMQ